MAPPTYEDLGKSCRDVFTKGYNFGLFKLDCKTQTCLGDIHTGGTHDIAETKTDGFIKTKVTVPEYGLTVTKQWNTENNLNLDVACEEKIYPGVKVGAVGEVNIDTGKKSGRLTAQYKSCNATADMAIRGADEANPEVNGSVVVGYQGWLGGGSLTMDGSEGTVSDYRCALGFCSEEFHGVASADNNDTFTMNLYQRVNDRVEGGVQGQYKPGSPTTLSIGSRFLLNPCTAIRAKVNSDAMLGLGMETSIREGVNLTMSTQIDVKNFSAGGHQVGLGLEFKQ